MHHAQRQAAATHSAYRSAPIPAHMVPPPGYMLVEDDMHRIGIRDMVFTGGMHSDWRPARRAGEAGSLRRDSVALSVARLG